MAEKENTSYRITDERIRGLLQERSKSNVEYWSFRGRSKRNAAHSLIQYPAMMVPQMQGEIIDILLAAKPNSTTIFDPFVGSGTVLTEAMRCGKRFIGFDINPLAILACQAKAGPFYLDALSDKIEKLTSRIANDRKRQIEINFPGWEKWFDRDVASKLSKVTRSIRSEPMLWARRFFWLAVVELTRAVSNSRTSTFKLHKRSDDDPVPAADEIVEMFQEVLETNFAAYSEQAQLIAPSLSKGTYSKPVIIKIQDSVKKSQLLSLTEQVDLMVTSPPYGDNKTTVPYGQFSFLALQWIDLKDIDLDLSEDILKSTHEIDARSLGGSIKNSAQRAGGLREISPSFWQIYEKLIVDSDTESNAKRYAAFASDLLLSIENASQYLRRGGYAVWTLGNRNTGGHVIPLADIVAECFEYCGIEEIVRLKRSIPYKRTPIKNNVSATMTEETTLILRKR
jgi:hypothetical protein